jgi:hypothetical protein
MRYLVYLLLVVNIAFFGWNLFRDGGTVEAGRELPSRPATVAPLVMLQEREGAPARAGDAAADGLDALTMTRPPATGMPAACYMLGPFLNEEELQAAVDRFVAAGLEPRQRLAEDRHQDGYWVYLPTMRRAEARRIAQALEAREDHDYYVGRDNFISLGTFSERERAENRLRQIQGMGLDPLLEARYVTQDVYWLEIRDGNMARPLLDEIAGGNPALQLNTRDCP